MSLLSQVSLQDLAKIQNKIFDQTKKSQSLEHAAHEYVAGLYGEFSESIVLVRHFVTIPFEKLPNFNKDFVLKLADTAGISEKIKNDTPVLSLLGTCGEVDDWNDRLKSKGHIGIPLVSADFIDKIPMMSRLLKQLGVSLDWIDSKDTSLVLKTFGNLSGVFYVSDAKTELDNQGRKIIASQDFVEKYGVKTVFGIGGCYLGTTKFFTTILFLRETINKELAERFMLQANKFKTSTHELVESGKIFS